MAESVYGLLLDDEVVEDCDSQPITPTSIEIEQIAKDPRRVTLHCTCGAEAIYTFKGAKRVLGVCASSDCMKQGLEQLERFAHIAKGKGWDLISGEDILERTPQPPPKPVRQQIRDFQEAEGLEPDGILDPRTCAALRAKGRSGMVEIWTQKLQEED